MIKENELSLKDDDNLIKNEKQVNKNNNNGDKKNKNKYINQNDNFNYNNNDKIELLGKKNLKKVNEGLSKSLNKMKVNDDEESESSESIDDEYESDNEMYESSGTDSDNYEEEDLDKIINKPKNKDNNLTLWNDKEELKKDEELIFDNSAYEMLHRSTVSWPCFSVDWILPEFFIPQTYKNFYNPIENKLYKNEFPYTCYFIAGAQTSEKNGFLYYMKWFNMHKTMYDDDPDKEADSESEGAEPLMEHIEIPAKGNVNKLKTMKNSFITAYQSDLKTIELVDLRNHIREMEERWQDDDQIKIKTNKKKNKLDSKNVHVKSFKKKDEGFALDWSNFNEGVFASGGYDNEVEIYIPIDEFCSDYTGGENNNLNFRTKFKAHKNGVEDICFSPSHSNILATSGNDKAIRIWDLRINNENQKISQIENAHDGDVNCLAWKLSTGIEMIASGSDDSVVKLWDPRKMSDSKHYIARIDFHKEPITALSWDPISPCQLAVTSEDNRLTIWDFSVEPDDEKINKIKDTNTKKEIPDQLVFLHQGQTNLKDVKFHPYFDSVLLSSAESGLNIFKPNFLEEDSESEEDFTFNN